MRRCVRIRVRSWLIGGCLVWLPLGVAAQDLSARAYLDRNEVAVGQVFVVNVELTGAQRFDQNPELPDLEAFASYLGSGTSTSMTIVNGATTLSVTTRYQYQATREGTFEIPAITVHGDGKTLRTDPLTLRVTKSAGPATSGGPAPRTSDTAALAPEDLFIAVEPNKRQVYENEPVIVEYRLYTRVDVRSYGVTRLPGTTGFWMEEFDLPPRPTVEQVVRDGQKYATALLRKVALFPTGPGTRTIEPLAIEAQVHVRRRSRDPFDDLFGGSGLFGDVQTTGVASRPVEIEVLPLPAQGRPDTFTGLVGDLDVSTRLDPDSVAANEAVTFRVRVSGSGNLKGLAPPEIEFPPTVEAFPPEVSDDLKTTNRGVTGTRTYDYVLIPRAPGTLTVPGLEMGYYDDSEGEYALASAGPLHLVVTGRPVEDGLPGARARAGIEELRTDIRFIRTDTPRFRRRGRTVFGHPLFWATLLIPIGAIGGGAGVRRHRERLEGDRAYARNRRAGRLARKRLARARELAEGTDARAFFAETGQALEGFAADKLDVSAAGSIREELGAALARRGASEGTIGEYMDCLAVCDRQRFAPVEAELEERHAFLKRAESALSTLAGELG